MTRVEVATRKFGARANTRTNETLRPQASSDSEISELGEDKQQVKISSLEVVRAKHDYLVLKNNQVKFNLFENSII